MEQYRAEVTDGIKWLMRNVPFYLRWYRFTLSWRYGDGLHRHLKRDPAWPHPERSLNRSNGGAAPSSSPTTRSSYEGATTC